jgi:class 3 adenylate cyclase
MQERCLPSEAVYKTIEEIIRFAEVEGAEMCLAQGYSPVRLQIGASAGLATVICDSFQARTSGKVVNQAARLQKAGQPGQVFVHTDLVKQWPTEGSLRSDVAQDELKKTRRLTGHRVYLRKTAS